jgi:hypothetical protein
MERKRKTTQGSQSRKTSSKAIQPPLPDLFIPPRTGLSEQDQKNAELLAWGEAHAYWELNFCRLDGSLGRVGPCPDNWRTFVAQSCLEDLDLAYQSMVAWRTDEANPDSLLQVPVVVKRRGVEDRGLFMRTGKALGYPLVRFRAESNGMIYHIQAGREVWLHQCLMATDEWLSWAIFAAISYQNEAQVQVFPPTE